MIHERSDENIYIFTKPNNESATTEFIWYSSTMAYVLRIVQCMSAYSKTGLSVNKPPIKAIYSAKT